MLKSPKPLLVTSASCIDDGFAMHMIRADMSLSEALGAKTLTFTGEPNSQDSIFSRSYGAI